MSKSIAMVAGMIAVVAAVTTAQAGPTTPANELVTVGEAGSFQVAWNWPRPRPPARAVAAVRG